MRQVNRDELIYAIINATRGVSRQLRKDWLDGQHVTQKRAQAVLAGIIADGLTRYEVLTTAPLPMTMGDNAFSRPVQRLLGEDVASGAPHEDA